MQQGNDILTLFVYGTLTRASRHPFARRLAMESRFIGRGTVNGMLYSLGCYPGLVEEPGQKCLVHGEAVQLKQARSLAWLDDYEGCGPNWPAPHDFERKMLSVRLLDGGEIPCWIYVFKGKVTRFRRIPDGRFMPL
jgi:gamma-glutamylcyclotransferase (GGCT)/AIG2-like uncharacterized protein YtfP